MTPQEAQENIRACIQELSERVPNFVLSFGQDITAIVKERITTKGEGAKGKFPAYTPKYSAYKTKKGKNQGFRDLNMTGSLMQNFKAFKEDNQYKIGFSDEGAKKIAAGNSYGNNTSWKGVGYDVIEPTKKEIDEEIVIFEKQILKILHKYMA